jgi:hypothetical protein
VVIKTHSLIERLKAKVEVSTRLVYTGLLKREGGKVTPKGTEEKKEREI